MLLTAPCDLTQVITTLTNSIVMSSITFKGVVDRYDGVTVISTEEPCDVDRFNVQLIDSLQNWSNKKKRCIWFKVNIKDSEWVPILAKNGFNFHHSREDFVMMFKWLPTESSPNLPPACHTSLGVGGMVFNSHNQLLVVVEQHNDLLHWKLPGGYVERGEDIKDAVIREVKEETGIDAVFESMVTYRHTHNAMFGNSDIYIVIKLKATSETIVKSDIEIKECKWMDVDEFLNHPKVIEFNRFIVKQAIDLEKRNLKLNLPKHSVTVGKFSREITALVVEDL